jgi:hypothetical protein
VADMLSSTQGVAPQQIQGLMDVTTLVRSEGARTRTIDTLATLASRPTVTLDENKVSGTAHPSSLPTSALVTSPHVLSSFSRPPLVSPCLGAWSRSATDYPPRRSATSS